MSDLFAKLNNLKLVQVRAIAKRLQTRGRSGKRKKDLIDLIIEEHLPYHVSYELTRRARKARKALKKVTPKAKPKKVRRRVTPKKVKVKVARGITVVELKKKCKEQGIKGYSKWNKEKLMKECGKGVVIRRKVVARKKN